MVNFSSRPSKGWYDGIIFRRVQHYNKLFDHTGRWKHVGIGNLLNEIKSSNLRFGSLGNLYNSLKAFEILPMSAGTHALILIDKIVEKSFEVVLRNFGLHKFSPFIDMTLLLNIH